MTTMNQAWATTLQRILIVGDTCQPRGKEIRELLSHTIQVDMNYPVLTNVKRKPNYRFMAAEAWWILRGSDLVQELTPYNKRMAEFSDDGVSLAGAYGPRFVSQLDYVVAKLKEDPDTRQATMTTWVPNPTKSKDIPCTIALDFKIRDGHLNTQVFMRSSDAWLGLPYDVFSFTMMTCAVLEKLNVVGTRAELGSLYLTAASSHLYAEHLEAAADCIDAECLTANPIPDAYHDYRCRVGQEAESTIEMLKILRDDPGYRWWGSWT